MIAKDYYQILSKMFLKEFITSNINKDTTINADKNINKDTMIKNLKLVELHTKYATAFLNTQILKMINRIHAFMLLQNFDEKLKERFSNAYKYSMITISLFYYCENVFIFMSI